MTAQSAISRRDLLRAGTGLFVGFAFSGAKAGAQATATSLPPAKIVDSKEVDSFLLVHDDGSVTIYTGKVDLGTGLRISVRQMAAEELGLPVEKVGLIEGDTSLTPDQGRTGGSSGLTQGGVGVRQAAATARVRLLQLGADKLDHPVSDVVLRNARVEVGTAGTGVPVPGVPIKDLLGGKHFELKVNPNAVLKDPAKYTVVGKSLPRPDVPGKCTGAHQYVSDLRLPGMLHGRVIRPPAIGAKLISVDETSVRGIPDVRVVRIQDFLGVVAKNEWAAIRAAQTLQAKWSDWQGLPGHEQLPRAIRESVVDHDERPVKRGDSAQAISHAVRHLAATYYTPYQGHASMGPSCGVADVKPEGITVWTGSQSTHLFRTIFSETFGLPEENIRFVYLDGSGCYGQNGHEDAAADAAILSKAVGAPVRVQWMRHDEHGWDPKGPPHLIDMRAGVTADGQLAAWETELWVPMFISAKGTIPLVGFDAAGMKQRQGRWPGSIDENLDPPYATPNVTVTVHRLKDSPLRTGHVRAPGKVANVFALESLSDEVAASAAQDAVAWRLKGLTDARALEVLKRAADMIGWQSRPSPNPKPLINGKLTGRGVAYVRYRGNENYVATTMQVAVDPATGKIDVLRVACAHDCGLVINPDALKNQIEGSVIQALSKMLHEEVQFDRAHVTSVDWVSYPVLRFPEVPLIEVALIDRPTMPLMGAGEAAMAPVGGALANAVFDATGVRLRVAPFTPDRVKAALLAKA